MKLCRTSKLILLCAALLMVWLYGEIRHGQGYAQGMLEAIESNMRAARAKSKDGIKSAVFIKKLDKRNK